MGDVDDPKMTRAWRAEGFPLGDAETDYPAELFDLSEMDPRDPRWRYATRGPASVPHHVDQKDQIGVPSAEWHDDSCATLRPS